jgi:hypothetical protein
MHYRAGRQRTGYDNAQVCTNGHIITQFADREPEHLQNFCEKCGAATIRACPKCSKKIQGFNYSSSTSRRQAPPFCYECGTPFPWTAQILATAQRLAEEDAHFSVEEREQFQESLTAIVKQTPNSPLAVSRFKKLLTKGGRVLSDGLRDILVDVMSEAVKKAIWPS